MLREIRVYGRLAKFLGRRKFRAEVSSVADAVRFLLANFPQVERHMIEQHYRVSIGEMEIGHEELHHPASSLEPIKIVPVVAGAGGGVGKIIAGVALVALTIVTGGFGGAAIGLFGAAAPLALGTVGLAVGASLVLGGVAQLLTPVPTLGNYGTSQAGVTPSSTRETELDPQKSYSFSGIQQTSTQGTPLPICYGETVIGSVVISAGIDTVQVAA